DDAVIFDNDRYYVVTGDRDFAIREIIPFDNHNGLTYISEGLHAGEEIVSRNQLLIYNELKGNCRDNNVHAYPADSGG
ncbi:MAG: hypothetical protein LBM08_13025, partial [Dysgonamonadaceae bacterium]|nr:hypothetical protein [Dysgonamonadaceae bacterium]